MTSPCHACLMRTAIPNCHSTCDLYQEYNEERQRIRQEKYLDREGDDARIRGASRTKAQLFRRHKSRGW